jgi:hypothetical protein
MTGIAAGALAFALEAKVSLTVSAQNLEGQMSAILDLTIVVLEGMTIVILAGTVTVTAMIAVLTMDMTTVAETITTTSVAGLRVTVRQ